MKNAVTLITVVLLTISPGAFASTEDMPDIDTYNWISSDDFSDVGYSLNNWDLNIPSAMTFGINADDEYGYLSAPRTSSSVNGYVAPVQGPDIFGVRADIRLTSLDTGSSNAAYYALGYDITPIASLYWGFTVLDGKLEGSLLFSQNGNINIYHGDTDFDVVLGQTYNLAMVFDDEFNEYYFYLNGEKIINVNFPGVDTSFSNVFFEMFSRNIDSQFEFDNFEFATIPEPATMLMFGLSGLIIRKHR